MCAGRFDEAAEILDRLFWLKATGFFDAVGVEARLRELLDQVRVIVGGETRLQTAPRSPFILTP